MMRLDKIVVVEGKYDKIKLCNFLDAEIVTTDGFRIFKDKEKIAKLRKMAEKRGIIILTDSDSAGFMIRNHLCGSIDNSLITNVFIPEIKGKERRKTSPSKQGLLGVEGVNEEIILKALEKAGVAVSSEKTASETREKITKTDLFCLGLSGGEGSAEKREELLKRLELPTGLSPSQLLTALNALYPREEFLELASHL